MKERLTNGFLWYAITLLLVFTLGASYVRFMVQQDYVVSYEVECNPETDSCYVGCANDDCTEEYYYAVMSRHNNTVQSLCGLDVTDCEAAQTCSVNESRCAIEYCAGPDCSTLTINTP